MKALQCNCSTLRSAARVLSAAYDEALRPTGLKMTQFSILARLAAVGPITQNQFANVLAMDRSTLGRNLRPLQRDKFVRLDIGEDRRERVVDLTAAGRRMLAKAMPLWEEIHQRFEDSFGAAEAVRLRHALNVVIKVGRELSSQNEDGVDQA
ncbi:MarR family winged helix-turn-helix transcriptional regulator [Caballeronia sp. dw_19]|uniref:MarR family winged helix-turn-helix transcriptional regulator n=1 Tax=Caballeronia sp. dw_19 TaxID=2719791 RepID=UPI001BD376BE|nr:MarR family winged helix-turn-helix transcriptional regulator [Caballeronia sp. dw_19]